MSHMIKSPA